MSQWVLTPEQHRRHRGWALVMGNPAPVLQPIAHYDASVLGLGNGATVSTWADLAGIQGAFAPAGGTATYVTAAQNGLGVVELALTTTKLNATWAVVPTRPFTLFVAGKSLSAVASQTPWFHQTFALSFFMNGSVWDLAAGGNLTGGTQDTAFHVWTFLVNGATSKIRVDGTQIAAGDSGSSAATGVVNQLAGAFRFGEIYAYDGDATGLGIESSLRAKWATA